MHETEQYSNKCCHPFSAATSQRPHPEQAQPAFQQQQSTNAIRGRRTEATRVRNDINGHAIVTGSWQHFPNGHVQ